MILRLSLLALLGLVIVGVPAAVAGSVDEPDYTVISKLKGAEVREYAPLIRAETVVSGPYKESLNTGFRILANYIFGGNTSEQKIAMTAPVGAEASRSGEKIAMTAPVGAEATERGWTVSFVMPAKYTLDTLPRPLDARITLRQVPAARVAALRFRGWAGEASVAEHKAELAGIIAEAGLVALGEPTVAQYNPPWTLPFLRRNEILVAVGSVSGLARGRRL